MSPRLSLSTVLVSLLATAFAGFACDNPAPPLEESELAANVVDQPEVFVVEGDTVTLQGLEDFHLGQSEADALEALKHWCDRPVVLEQGALNANTVFKGCPTPDHPFVRSLRIGFHPEMDDAVFTVELERDNVPASALRARFWEKFGEPADEVVKPGIVQASTERYHMFADWDDGNDGPTHVIVGYRPDALP